MSGKKRPNAWWGNQKPIPPQELATFVNALRAVLELDPIPNLEHKPKKRQAA